MSVQTNFIDLTEDSPQLSSPVRVILTRSITKRRREAIQNWPAISPLSSSPLVSLGRTRSSRKALPNNTTECTPCNKKTDKTVISLLDTPTPAPLTTSLNNIIEKQDVAPPTITPLQLKLKRALCSKDDLENCPPSVVTSINDNTLIEDDSYTLQLYDTSYLLDNYSASNSTSMAALFPFNNNNNNTAIAADKQPISIPADAIEKQRPKKQKRRKLTDEERQRRKEQKEKEKADKAMAREAKRLEKERQKEKLQIAKAMKKQQQQEKLQMERTTVLEIRKLNVNQDKELALGQMIIVLNNFSLLNDDQTVIREALADITCDVRDASQLSLDSMAHVTWRRRRVARYDNDQQLFLPNSPNTAATEVEEPFVAAILSVTNWMAKTDTTVNTARLVQSLKQVYPNHRPILMIHGIAGYLRKRKNVWHRWYAKRVRNNQQLSQEEEEKEPSDKELGPDQQEIERRFIELQLRHRCLIVLIEQWHEAARWIKQFGSEIAIGPQRKIRAAINGLPRVPSGRDANEGWRIMLEQIYLCGAQAAAAIARQYPSPSALHLAYNACSSPHDAEHMLASLPIHNGSIGTQHTRRLGPTLSRRIYRVFCGNDPNEIVS
ncbi:hypothetical protein BDF19DRAFT_419906 [Syncephalis fuscata]|nr:hypothetical protein BDF19DRAFT_419906 [Syncephalis fuscata]